MVLDRLQFYFLKGLLSLPKILLSLIAGRPQRVGEQTLDLQLQVLLKLLALGGVPAFEDSEPVELRKLMAANGSALSGRVRKMARVEDREIRGPGGRIPLRIYTPYPNPRSLPVLVYYHGGGWVIGDLNGHDAICRRLAHDVGAIIVSVDYRLAPEHRFPAAVEDAVAAYVWARGQAASFGGDPSRVAVGGDSAGGNLAAVVAAETRETTVGPPIFQLLVYPVTGISAESKSYESFAHGYFLTRAGMRWFRTHYLDESSDPKGVSPKASPLRIEDVVGLAPAFIMTAGFDPLRDEGKAYAERLMNGSVEVDYRNYPGLIHGFFSMADVSKASNAAFVDAVAALTKAFS